MFNPAQLEASQRVAELRRQNEGLKRAKQLRQNYGINFYQPHAKQDRFHTVTSTGRYARTGNRFGKSEMGIAEDIAWCMGGRVWYRESFDVLDGEGKVVRHHTGHREHPFVSQAIPTYPVKGLLLVVDWDMAKKVFTNREGDPTTWGKLFKLLPREAIGKVHLSRGGHVDQINIKRPTEFGGGESTLTLDTIEAWKHNKLGGESADWDFIHIDEPIPEKMYKSYGRGLMDRNGKYWFTCTPLDEMWINDKFTPNTHLVGEAEDGLVFGTKFIITGSIYDNPHRSPEGVAEFEQDLTNEERECRLYGLPLAMAGKVYKEFIFDMHVLCDVPKGWDDYHLPPKDYTTRVAWDVHGARVPQAILFTATAPTGDVFVYDELFCEPLIGPNAKLVKAKLEGRNVTDQIIDPRALIINPVTNRADVLEAIEAEDLYFDPGSKDLTAGVSAVKVKLKERHVVTNLPTIWFSPRVTRTLWEFDHYVYDLEKNTPKDKDDHMMENLRRLVLNGLEYVPPRGDYIKPKPYAIKDNVDLSMLARTKIGASFYK